MGFFDYEPMSAEDYAALPALVPKGADREEVLNRVVEGWCTSTRDVSSAVAAGVSPAEEEDGLRGGRPLRTYSTGAEDVDEHFNRGGFLLEGVDFRDDNTGQLIDLGDLLRRVERRLRAEGAPEEFKPRPDLSILLRRCRVPRCKADELNIRPRFIASRVQFGDQACFFWATFGRQAIFFRATFGDQACFAGAKFGAEASFFGAAFGDQAAFTGAAFGAEANFIGARFGAEANFFRATLGDQASFYGATFGGKASFEGASLRGASLAGTGLNRARLCGTDLREANLEGVRGLVLDCTYVRDAVFAPRADDPWSRLRRAYTGPKLLFNLFLLTAFFLPYVVKTAGWVTAYRAQKGVAAGLQKLETDIGRLEPEHPATAQVLRNAVEGIKQELPGPENPRARESRVWRLVLGVDKGNWYWVTALALIAYNLLRAGLTFFVAPMRDAEERSGLSPRYTRQKWTDAPKTLSHSPLTLPSPPEGERGWGLAIS
ncbi:MAG: pentapeptide repeat-containing protein [Planctomycetota bacterium]